LGLADRDIPADIYASLRQGGAHVFRRKLGNSSISGLFIKHPAAGHCLLVNYSEDIYRQRFSAGHEMAHSVYDADDEASVSYVRQQGADLREVRANRFASCLLMPPAALAALPPPDGWDEARALGFAKQFRVSCDALGVALQAGSLASADTTARIRSLRVPRDEKADPELAPDLTSWQRQRKAQLLERGLSDFYVGLCFDAFGVGAISAGRLAEALLTSLAGAEEIGQIYGRSLHGDD
jgi:Zn-dependent peptidase ImmA (M78 family)